jgi:putative FmdB family regulatory protein
MPLYEYLCDACGHRFEVIQKFSDPPVETCPKCGGRVQKLMSSPAFQFKGTGWYVTDYAKKSGGAAKEQESSAADKPEAKKDSSESSTPEPSTKTKAS